MTARAPRNRALMIAAGRLAVPFWRSRASRRAWLLAAIIAAGLYGAARMAIWSNAMGGDMTNAVVGKDVATLRSLLLLYVPVIVAMAAINAAKLYLQQWIEIDWRRDMTGRLLAAWLDRGTYYRLERDRRIENADQRIGEDAFLFVDQSLRLVLASIEIPASIFVYALLLWTLGGPVDLAPIGLPLTLPGGMLWIALAALIVIVAIMLAAGYPLLSLNVQRQGREADFRFALANVRINAEQIALYGGGATEAARLDRRMDGIVSNWYRLTLATLVVVVAASLYNQANGGVTMLFGYRRYLRGEIDFGQVTQIAAAVGGLAMSIYALVQFFQNGTLYTWAAAVRRLDALQLELERTPVSGIALRSGAEAGLATHGLRLARPDGTPLATVGDRRFAPGDRWLVQGPSGTGKSTMMRALAGLWPYGAGEIVHPADGDMLFLPQKSYVPEGSLHAALCYPSDAGRFDRAACAAVLDAVRLSAFVARLDEDARWQERLSPGEQQRLAFARVLLHRPAVVLLDEATSALDVDNERHLYELLDRRLPDAAIVSIGHRDTLERFHPHRLSLDAPPAGSGAPDPASSFSREPTS